MENQQPRFEPDLAAVAALIGEPSRAAILWQLADGRALAAGGGKRALPDQSWRSLVQRIGNRSGAFEAAAACAVAYRLERTAAPSCRRTGSCAREPDVRAEMDRANRRQSGRAHH